MNERRILVLAATAICWVIMPGCGPASAENSSAGVDTNDAFDRTGTIMPNGTSVQDLPAAVEPSSTDQILGKNPLWGIPLEVLNANRDRPLFSRSRRPLVTAVIGPPVKAVKAVSHSAAPKPTLNLVGTVEGNSDGYAIFIDTTTHSIVRLKTGEGEDGWVLRSVSEREAVLYKNHRTEVLELPSITERPNK